MVDDWRREPCPAAKYLVGPLSRGGFPFLDSKQFNLWNVWGLKFELCLKSNLDEYLLWWMIEGGSHIRQQITLVHFQGVVFPFLTWCNSIFEMFELELCLKKKEIMSKRTGYGYPWYSWMNNYKKGISYLNTWFMIELTSNGKSILPS